MLKTYMVTIRPMVQVYFLKAPSTLKAEMEKVDTISCSIGTPCLVAATLSPAVGYCSSIDNTPVTTTYDLRHGMGAV